MMTHNIFAFRQLCSGLLISLAALLWLPAAAHAESINVASVDGQVSYRINENTAWQGLEAGMALNMPVDIKTAAHSHAVISQGGSTFTIKSNSRFTLHGDNKKPGGLITRIKQWFGTVFYDVERQPDTFSVETPFLVSTVKGTKFVIVSTDTSSFVTLNEGRLEVQDVQSGETNIINAGDIAGLSATSSGVKTMNQSSARKQVQTNTTANPPPAGATGVDDSDGTANRAGSQSADSFENALSGINEDAAVQQNDMMTNNNTDSGDDVNSGDNMGSGDDMNSGGDMGAGDDMDPGDDMDSGDEWEQGEDDPGRCGNGLCTGNDKIGRDDDEDD